ncbi:PilZ domain-containing protein [Halomonas sp. DWK9]|uniref:PilZ domain-containing protein n=1 Tax=Halomonas sp. DWK9 TaxID=3060155 RepID=UPI00287FC06E|nr:PilZ domain-containing protein [Halomonas sp. DWK9]
MPASAPLQNPTAHVVQSFLKHQYEICLYSKDMPYALQATIIDLNSETGFLVLEVECHGESFNSYVRDGMINFDIETLHPLDGSAKNSALTRDIHSVSNIPAKVVRIDSSAYRLECQLPSSVFLLEQRGAVRIPFILGMRAKVSVEVYVGGLIVVGNLRNISVGGCLVDVAIEDTVPIAVGQPLPGVTIEFPNGASFFAEGIVRHMRPFGNHGYAALGVEYINLEPHQAEELFYIVNEAEREAAYRSGTNDRVVGHSPLFIPGAVEKSAIQREEKEQKKRLRQSPMQRGILELAHQLQYSLMYIKSRDHFPEKVIYDCADAILYLLRKDRKALLYALAFLHNEPDWVRQAVRVAAQMADIMLIRDPHSIQVREAVVGALLHTMGKPLLVSEELPTLKTNMSPRHKEILKNHVVTLRDKLHSLGWRPSKVCEDIILHANELLDGTGYPFNIKGSQLTENILLVSVVKAVNKLIYGRNGVRPLTPLNAYRLISEAPQCYDKATLVEYIQCYGLYPIGNLAKFSGGFLAWIIDVDGKGMPIKVNVVKNLAFIDTNIDSVLEQGDFSQIGRLEGVVDPNDYGVRFYKV